MAGFESGDSFAPVDSKDFAMNLKVLDQRGNPDMRSHWEAVLISEQVSHNGALFDAVLRDVFNNFGSITTPEDLRARVQKLKEAC